LQGQLIQCLKPADRADFAVAFISLAGLKRILPKLRQMARRGGVRIITGLYQDVTEPAALRKLLSVSNETGGRLSIRISRNHRFHMKLYLLMLTKRMTALIGSSNLSNDGLLSDGELVMSLSIPATPRRRSSS
jgi:HKD family nuclease